MMKKKFVWMLSIMLVVTATSYADERSERVLGELSSKINSLGNYRATFTATAEGNDVTGEYVVSGNKYYMKAGEVEIICDGKVKYEINHDDDEVMVDNIDPNDRNILTNPTRAFDFAGDTFTHAAGADRMFRGKNCAVVTLRPKAANTSIRGVTLLVDKATGLPVLLSYAADGLEDEVDIVINSIISDNGVSQNLFRFDRKKYPGYEIIDFR